MQRTQMERFWSKVNKMDGCWEWVGLLNRGCGYGRHCYEGKDMKAHRLSYMIHHPLTIDLQEHPKLQVCHKCDNPKCVNPSHLWLGTHTDNMRDKQTKGRQSIGEKHGSVKLTEQQVRDIREKYEKGNTTHRKLADEYGVSKSTISDIINRKNWAHIN